MSKRYKVKRFNSCYSMNWVDNKTNKELTALEVEEILHKQDQRIAELEEQLKNCIRPKFKIDEEVLIIDGKIIRDAVIDEIYWTSCKNCFEYYTRLIYGINDVQYETIDENELFATKEDALKKLKELKGE